MNKNAALFFSLLSAAIIGMSEETRHTNYNMRKGGNKQFRKVKRKRNISKASRKQRRG